MATALVGCRGPTPAELAKSGLEWVESKDAGAIVSRTNETEQKVCNFTDESAKKMLDTLWLKLSGFKPTSQIVVESSSGNEMADAYRTYAHADGRRAELRINAVQTAKGVEFQGVSFYCFTAMAMAGWPASKGFPSGKEKSLFFANSLQELGPSLSAAGVSGVRLRQTADFVVFSWAEYEQWHRQRAVRLGN